MSEMTVFLLAGIIGSTFLNASVTAEGNEEAGKQLFENQCAACHSIKPGAHLMGPSLAGIIGLAAGGTDYGRYVGLMDLDFSWNAENLDEFLTDPAAFLGRQTSMFSTVADANERADVIEYLETLK